MIIAGTIIAVLMIAVMWLLWTPLRLEIDSEAGLFQLEWRHVVRINWLPEQAPDCVRVRAPFLDRQFRMTSISQKQAPVQRQREQKPPSTQKPLSLKSVWRMTRNVLQSFEVKRLYIDWDSDDFIWNAQAYPLACVLNSRGDARIQINFMGRREVALVLENRVGRLLGVVLHTFFTKQ